MMTAREITPEEKLRAMELSAVAFESKVNRENITPDPSDLHRWAAFNDDGEMVSTITVHDFQFHFDGSSCKMAGIGDVATPPQFRRQGGVRQCFLAVLPHLYQEGYDFSYLYPFSNGFYRKFGYENCVQRYQMTVNLQALIPVAADGYTRLVERRNPMVDALHQVDQVWERKFNMMVLHRQEDYGWAQKADPFADGEYTYVYFAADGTPKAYSTFRKEVEGGVSTLSCSRFCIVDREGFHGLMQLFKSMSADHRLLKFKFPAINALTYLFREWNMQGTATWSVQAYGMVRVINVQSVLEKAKYIGSGQAVLEIRDPHIPENNGIYQVCFRDGKATQVVKSQNEPDMIMDITAFSALIAGVSDFNMAQEWMEGFQVRSASPALARIFYQKPMMIAVPF